MKKIKISIDIPNTNLKNNLEAYKCPKCNKEYLNGEQAKKFDITIDVETVKGKKIYVARCLNLDIASQGYSYEEAEKNIKEAIELYLETYPDALKTPKKKISLL